jgi:hypothetical protein
MPSPWCLGVEVLIGAADFQALQQERHGDDGLEYREVRSDAGALAAAEREVGVGVPRTLAIRGEASRVERFRVIPESRMPMRRELAQHDV